MSELKGIDQQAWKEWWKRAEDGTDDEVLLQIDDAVGMIISGDYSEEEVGQLCLSIIRLAFGRGFQAGLMHTTYGNQN
jgi:hypothetical protein